MINKIILIVALIFVSPAAFACQSDFDCGSGQYCKRGSIDFDTQEGICEQKTEFQRNPASIFDKFKKY